MPWCCFPGVAHLLIILRRCEAVRHCRWVDEVVSDCPWVLTEEFIYKHEIDYVAHDEAPYVASGHEDVYAMVKRLGECICFLSEDDLLNMRIPLLLCAIGRFLPTRRTPGVSTSELLERIVTGYRSHVFDEKLAKMGHAELRMGESSEGSG